MTTFVIVQWNNNHFKGGACPFLPLGQGWWTKTDHSHPISLFHQPQAVKLKKNSPWLPQRQVVIWSEKAG
jgi:hypothetical protein